MAGRFQRQRRREQHAQFTDKVRSFERSFQKKKTRLSIDIAEFIKHWWQTHILGPDKQTGAFLSEKSLC